MRLTARWWFACCVVLLVACLGGRTGRCDDTVAREHKRIGSRLDKEGKYDQAIGEYQAGYDATHDPSFLYNIAVEYEKKGDRAKALDFYTKCMEQAPPGGLHDQAGQQIDRVTSDIAAERERKIKESVEAGKAAYMARKYGDAISAYSTALQLSGNVALHVSLGDTYYASGDPKHAIAEYQAYLSAAPAASDASQIRAQIRASEAMIGAKDKPATEPESVPVSSPPVREPPPRDLPPPPLLTNAPSSTGDTSNVGSTQRIAGWVVGGAGVAAVATSVVFAFQAMSKNSDAHTNGCDAATNICTGSAGSVGYGQLQDSASDAKVADITLLIGVVAVAGGVVLYLTAPRAATETRRADVQLVPTVGKDSFGLTLSGGF